MRANKQVANAQVMGESSIMTYIQSCNKVWV
jgi:hypothetical protein